MSRGIDLINLNFVINYDCPSDIFIYIHRIGRCSSVNSEGNVFFFFLEIIHMYENVCNVNIYKHIII